MLMNKIFTLIAAALFAASVNAKEAIDLPSPWSDSFVVSGQTITITGAWQGGATYIGDADKTAYDYVWIKFTNATGKPNFGITYNEWQKKESWGDVFASSTAVVDGSGVVGIKLDKETVMVKGNAETDGVGIGDVYAQHVQQITIQSQNENASLTVEGIWFGTAAEFAADGGDVPVRPGYGESLVIWEGSTVYNGWGVSDSFDAKNFSVAKVGDIIRCTIKDVVLEGDNAFNPIFKYQDWSDFAPIQSTLETDKATYFEGTIADEEALAYLKASGLRLQGLGFTLTKVELVNNGADEGGEGGDDASEIELPFVEGHTLLVADIEAAGGTDTDVIRFYINNNSGDSREGWGIGGFANSDNWSPTEEWTGKAGDSWTYDYTVAKIKEVAGTEPGQYHGIGITINIYNECSVAKVVLEKAGDTGVQEIPVQVISNGIIYNLAGQKVDENYKGIVIKNGKKYFQK